MLQMQAEMNARVDADWRGRGREWYRAIWIECAELMDHYGGWKWWKAAPHDAEQVLLEIVDIWHFGLSLRIAEDLDHRPTANAIASEWCEPPASAGFLRDVEHLAAAALRDSLFTAYVGKNVLNFFRQDHGYRTGVYTKIWAGREDNEHLVEILAALHTDTPDFRESVYAALRARYPLTAA